MLCPQSAQSSLGRGTGQSHAQEQEQEIREEESPEDVPSNAVMLPVFTGLWQRQVDYKYYSNIYLAGTPQVWGVVVGTVRQAHNPSLKVQVLVLCCHAQRTVLAPRVALFVFQARAEGLWTCRQQIASRALPAGTARGGDNGGCARQGDQRRGAEVRWRSFAWLTI